MTRRPARPFVEADYLAANPDVAQAVAAGAFRSGRAHYETYGRFENRALRPGVRSEPLSLPFPDGFHPQRRDCILSGLALARLEGIEIGALTSPLVTRQEGNIFYVDHADTETLKASYRMHAAVETDKIVPVDGVWGENTLQDCLGDGRKVDYVVASHVIEHTPDMVTWLREIRGVLRPGGTLRLAIPDKRYTFDVLRFESRTHDLLDAYLRRARTPLPRLVLEHHILLRHIDRTALLDGSAELDALEPYNTLQGAMELARDALVNGTYHDVHCWIFTPLSFADICIDLVKMELLDFACDYYIDTKQQDGEFFVSMVASENKTQRLVSWTRMKEELRASATA